MDFNGSLKLVWNSELGIQTEERLKAAQRYIDSECIRLMVPYTPRRNGFLEESVKAGTVIGSGELKYLSRYARYLYYGEVYGPNIPIVENGQLVGYFSPPKQPKHPTGQEMHYDKSRHPQAGKLWFERMKADHIDELKRGVIKAIRGK